MPSSTEILLEYVCPSLGVIMANFVFSAPIKALKSAVLTKSLGDLNPVPWAFMTGNCLGWVAYSYLIKDPFVLLANVPGIFFSIWLNTGAIKLQYHDGREPKTAFTRQERTLYSILGIWVLVLTTVAFADMTEEVREMTIGIVVNINLVFFYGAPLSTIFTVLMTRNSSSIHFGTLFSTLLNCSFWFIYGLAVRNGFLFIPNGVGLILAVAQAVLYFGCTREVEDDNSSETVY